MATNPLSKLPGFIGYLFGSFFIIVAWVGEKLFSPFKKLGKQKKSYNKRR